MKDNSDCSLRFQHSSETEDGEKFNQPVQRDDDFQGPVDHRKCVDIPWAVALVLSSILSLSVFCYAFTSGDPSRLLHGHDYRGMVCGKDALAADEYAYFLQPESSLAATCLDGCPIFADSNAVCLYDSAHRSELQDEPCYDAYLAKGFYNNYCLPADEDRRAAVEAYFQSTDFLVTRLLGDVVRGWDVVGLATLSSVSVAAVAVVCLQTRVTRFLFLLSALCLSTLQIIGFGFFLHQENLRISNHFCGDFGPVSMSNCHPHSPFSTISILLTVILSYFFLTVICQAPKLLRTQKVLRLAVMPVRDLCRGVLVPVMGFVAGMVVIGVAGVVGVHLASIGEIATVTDEVLSGEQRKDLRFDIWTRAFLLPAFFVTMWWLSSISYWVEFASASLSHQWYFAKDRRKLQFPLRVAIAHSISHIGSLACAAITQPLLLVLRDFLHGLKRCIEKFSLEERVACMKLWRFCGRCYEDRLKFRVEQTVPYQALWGEALGPASRKAFYLVERAHAESLIEGANLAVWIVDFTVRMSAPTAAYLIVLYSEKTLQGDPSKFLTSALFLSFCSLVCSWSVSSVLRGFLRGSLHGVLLSHFCEKEMFKGVCRAENEVIAAVVCEVEEQSGKVTAEDSLKPTGLDFPGVSYKEKVRPSSRISALNDSIIIDAGCKKSGDSFEVDDMSQTGIFFTHETVVITEGEGRPWTPANKAKPVLGKKQRGTGRKPNSCAVVPLEVAPERSLPIEDLHPNFPPVRLTAKEEDVLPDFLPYRFAELIKEEGDRKAVEKDCGKEENCADGDRAREAKTKICPPAKVRVHPSRSPSLRSKIL